MSDLSIERVPRGVPDLWCQLPAGEPFAGAFPSRFDYVTSLTRQIVESVPAHARAYQLVNAACAGLLPLAAGDGSGVVERWAMTTLRRMLTITKGTR